MTRDGILSRWLFILTCLAACVEPAGAAALVGTATNPASFYSASHFYAHYASGYYWVAFHDGTRPVLYSSRDAVAWQPATAAPGALFTSFNPAATGNTWAVRFSGNNIIAFGYRSADTSHYYRNAVLNADGTATWSGAETNTGLASSTALNALVANGKPILWQADALVGGAFRIGSQLSGPAWVNTPNAPALNTGMPAAGSNGGFSAGAVLATGGSDPNDLIVIRATTAGAYAPGSHRLVAIKYDASANLFDPSWFNVSNVGGIPEDATSEPFVGPDGSQHRRFAAVRDTTGNIHAVYTNRNDDVVHYKKAVGFNDSWSRVSAGINPPAETIDKLALTALDNNNLMLFYSKGDQSLWYRRFDGTSWGTESSLKTTVTDLNNTVGSMESAVGCSVGVAWNENTVSPFNVFFSLGIGACGDLSTIEGSSTITVTAPGSFEMVLTTDIGGGVREFYDLAESATRDAVHDLAGGVAVDGRSLWTEYLQVGAAGYSTGSDGTRPRLDLLEATPTRARIRQEASFQDVAGATVLAGPRAIRDLSIYPSGRSALRWNRRTTTPVTFSIQDQELWVHGQSVAPLNGWSAYSQSGSVPNTSATDDFVLERIEVAGARTDFLHIMDRDWTIAAGHLTAASSIDLWVDTTYQIHNPWWHASTGATMSPGASPYSQQAGETWSFLTYFKPTNLGAGASPWLDPAVTSRSADYRTPATPTINAGKGSQWQDASENTGTLGDFYNESEAAYVFNLDPGLGLDFGLNGASTTRYSPFLKIRQWRSAFAPQSISVGGVTKSRNVDYKADVKPVARAHIAQDLRWHSTLQDSAAVDTTPDVGSPGSVSGLAAGDFVAARYGNGARVSNSGQYVAFSTADLDKAKGALEFWYQPTYANSDGVLHDICGFVFNASNLMVFEKAADNNLYLRFVSNGTTVEMRATAATYSWRAGDWVHIRLEWDDSQASILNQMRIVLNGSPIPPDISWANDYNSTNLTLAPVYRFGNTNGDASFASGVYDEIHVYGGSQTTPTLLAYGGLTSNASEYLADPAKSYPLSLAGVDPSRRGRYLTFGAESRFRGLNVLLSTFGAGVTAGSMLWEYWNGTTGAWADLEAVAGFTDQTSSFTKNGSVLWTSDPAGWAPYSMNGGPDLYYVRAHLPNLASYSTTPIEHRITTDILLFQYCADVTTNANFAFAPPVTTQVKLQRFVALPGDGSVTLEWRTASELDNLGFHLYRALAADGPWTRLNTSLIPGLGSSAVGQAYSFLDSGLTNGVAHYYRLEDVDASSKVTSHGPVSAVPTAVAGSGTSDGGTSGGTGDKGGAASCPDWVLSAYASSVGSSSLASLRCTRHGDPEAVSLGVLSRDSRQATLELKTGGFYALHTPAGAGEPAGGVRVFVPGFDFPQDAEAAALPLRRALVDAVVGRRVQLGGVRALDPVGFPGLVPSALGKAEMQVSRDGTVRAARRAVREFSPRRAPTDLVRLLPSVFQGETKSAVVEISPLRFDARRQQLVLAKRVRVRLLFTGRETGESGRGSVGRAPGSRKPAVTGELLARLYTTSLGLHAVSFEQLFPGRRRGFAASTLRLERQGRAVGFHIEPASDSFGPGSRLFFHADAAAASTDFSSETAWELLNARDGLQLPLVSAAPAGDAVSSPSTVQAAFEVNRYYQPGLLDAPDLWLWEGLASGATRAKSFTLTGVDTAASGSAELEIVLQGASESGNAIDHHVTVAVNGVPVGEAQFAGKKPYRMSLSLSESLLREGVNELSLTNVPDTGVSSYIFLDRFTVSYPQLSSLAGGVFEGTWNEGGTVTLGGLSASFALLDVTAAAGAGASWLTGYELAGGSLRFRAEAGHRYLAVSEQALLAPRVASPTPSSLRSTENQADYLLITPRALLTAAEPLVQRRQDQGLTVRAVAFEEIADAFGHGQPSAEAIQSFLAFAYHSWTRPSPRYVLLLGDSSYDPRNFTGTAQPAPLPALWTKTSYLWTVSDPELGAVNGEDSLPDLAIGRLPATSLAEANTLVQKLLAWEDSGQGLSGRAALVADNPDLAGDFEADVDDIAASFLQGREVSTLKLAALGGGTRAAIRDALDSGLSLLSYVGHGGAAVWASENVWNSWDAPSLQAQSQQPLLVTMNCLNGYFVAPGYNSLAESLLKAEGRGAIAGFSPSGLSLDGPAHQYHRALVAELTGGQHERLGDALLAAQAAYARAGLMPELLEVYHLFGDPATRIGVSAR
jgi:hypothetical protein